MPLLHSTVVRLTANPEMYPQRFTDQEIELIVNIAVCRAIGATQDVRSEPFYAGARTVLAQQLFGKPMSLPPYPEGSPSRDAWLAGTQYGNQIARIIHDSGWNLFLESTAA